MRSCVRTIVTSRQADHSLFFVGDKDELADVELRKWMDAGLPSAHRKAIGLVPPDDKGRILARMKSEWTGR